MVKEYRGSKTQIEPPPEGWSVIIYADGHKCQVAGAKIEIKEGKELIKFYLMPYPSVIRKFELDIQKDLDKNGYCFRWYPKEMVKPLNTYDPSRKIFFCLLDFNGKPTDSTEWFEGTSQAKEVIKLKMRIRELRAEKEKLKEENFILKTNVNKFFHQNVEGMLKPLLPFVKSMIEAEKKES